MNGGQPLGPGGQPLRINVDVNSLAQVICKGVKPDGNLCDSNVFFNCVELRVAPALLTGIPKDTVVTIPTYVCIKCGTPVSVTGPDSAIEDAARES